MRKTSRRARRNLKERSCVMKTARKGVLVLAAGAAFGMVLFPASLEMDMPATQVADSSLEKLTIENAKKRWSDRHFVQSYLNKALGSEKIALNTEVVYDPDSREAIRFWENQLREHPYKKNFIERQMRRVWLLRAETERFRQEYESGKKPEGGFAFASSLKGIDGSMRIFVHYMPPFFMADDDILWYLEHERCHIEARPTYNLRVNYPAAYTEEQVRKVIEAALDEREVEESACYTHQFREENRFEVSAGAYNAAINGYSYFHGELKRQSKGTDLRSTVIRELLGNVFLDPNKLQYR